MKRIAWLLAAGLAVVAFVLIIDGAGVVHRGGAASPPTASPPRASKVNGAAPGPDITGSGRARHSPRPVRRPQPSFGPFRLVLHTVADTIDVGVAPFSVGSYQAVDPPHNTARQWNTAAWIMQSTYPTRPRRGTAYIYGHACQYIVCSFNNLKDARVGDTAQIITRSARLTYQVDRIGLSPKTADSLPGWASDSTVPGRIVLVTCSYEQDGASPDNLVVIAHLVHNPKRV